MKTFILLTILTSSLTAMAEMVCEKFPASQLALDKNTAFSQKINDELQKEKLPAKIAEYIDILRGISIANSHIMDACDELNKIIDPVN